MGVKDQEEKVIDGATRFRRGLQAAALALIIIVLVTIILKELATILQPLFIGVFLCYLILPAHKWLTSHRIPSALSYILIVLVILGVTGGVGTLVVSSLTDLFSNVPVYEKKLDLLLVRTLEAVPFTIPGFEIQKVREIPFFDFVSVENVADTVKTTLGSALGVFSMIAVIIFYLIFIVAEGASFSTRVNRAFGEGQAERIMDILATINRAIAQYVRVKTFISFVIGAISALVLGLFGVESFMVWGVLTFFANFIPYIGSMVAVLFPIMLSFIQFMDAPWKGFVIMALLIGAQVITGNIIEPKLAGQKLGVSPLLILLSLAFWGWLWGIVGMVLAVPIIVIIKIILENIDQTRPIAIMMSDV